jgi:Gas vesicle synthesis protein GvpL/GvpF
VSRLAFAITRDRPDLPDLGDTKRLAFQGLAIVHGPAPRDALSPGLESLQAFASTVEALHARETVLPFRFGSLHDSDADLEAVLRVRLEEWRELLDDVEDCDEMGLRVLLDDRVAVPEATPPAVPSSTPGDKPGLAYLASRRARLAQRDSLQGEAARVEAVIVEALQGLYRRRVVEGPGPGRENLLSLVFLVPRVDLDAFREATSRLIERGLGKLLPTGPWPPYHFTSPNAPMH